LESGRRSDERLGGDRKAIVLKPDVAVIDLGMPDLDGMEAVRRIREAVPATKVLVLTMHESDHMVQRALDAGAHGYILKSDLTECLVKAVKVVSNGKPFLTPRVSEIMIEGSLKTNASVSSSNAQALRPLPAKRRATAFWQKEKPTRRSLCCWESLLGPSRDTAPRSCSSLASTPCLS
jgi:DNA-binding NarL/FixJ family response regulator